MKLPHFANLRDGDNMIRARTQPGLIRYSLALAILPPLFWFAPAIMRAIGEWW